MKFGSTGSLGAYRLPRGSRTKLAAAGFTLLEALCALAVAALALVALLQAFSGGQRGVAQLEKRFQARILAQSLLTEHAVMPGTGTRRGRYEVYDWTVEIEPALEEWAIPAIKDPWRLYRISVAVNWEPHGSIRLETVKLGINE